ncbi:MAG TPA: ROK family protein [Candidatus Limnocylindrales bacterium]|nr:ROK family protein [Candidatus Limnocylindrales bacterium]
MGPADQVEGPIVAVDLGGSRIRATIADEGGRLLGRVDRTTPASRGPDAVVDALAKLIWTALAGQPGIDDHDPARVVVAATGPFDPQGTWIDPSNLGPAYHGFPLGRELARRLGRPVLIGLDTHLALLGERRAGVLRGCRDAIYITVSTGVGGAFLVDDRLVVGAHGIAGEIGHLPVAASGPRCGCGGRGHLEALASGPAMAAAATSAARRGRSRPLLERLEARASAGLTGADVTEVAATGDEAATRIVARARTALGRAVTGLVNIVDPTRVVLGGGVVLSDPEPWIDSCRLEVAKGALVTQKAAVEIVAARLGDDAGLIGCLDHDRLGARWSLPDR